MTAEIAELAPHHIVQPDAQRFAIFVTGVLRTRKQRRALSIGPFRLGAGDEIAIHVGLEHHLRRIKLGHARAIADDQIAITDLRQTSVILEFGVNSWIGFEGHYFTIRQSPFDLRARASVISADITEDGRLYPLQEVVIACNQPVMARLPDV